ncbi:hypothetical protein GCM10011490_25250 [Pseudoclavibacter endophyticus]|uniref:Uncharacterized protein n=1 Tax=Pseudoclavibacter endophyticus TaxID=1778590 RepID=A0A6H9WPK8_9MICO|nr:hypothetical protein [Pseudoclavibacter endophyticus]KAB1647855.1 hypothetical protein F8O04_12610 [Pseudoclavibacter endophyticus]GGA73358.1 hypothetical protein GCM10011490_25250 [Pseudoclavibacter endophyticus]
MIRRNASGPEQALPNARRLAAAVAAASVTAALLAACAAAPLMEGLLYERFERVPPVTTAPADPTEAPDGIDEAPIATATVSPRPTETDDPGPSGLIGSGIPVAPVAGEGAAPLR